MPRTWTVVEPSLPASVLTYSFGGGLAHSLAIAVQGGVAVVSPPSKPDESAFADLAKLGPVKALIAPNAFHTMGLTPWKERYPDVPVFAPAQSIKRVEKQAKLTGIRPVADLAPMLGDGLEIVDMPHYKTGEALIRWRIEGGFAWYLTDVIMNMTTAPTGVFGAIFRWTKSAPGLRRNAVGGTFMVKDKAALYAWLVEQAEVTPPVLIVPCHGDVLRPSDPVAAIKAAVS